MKPRMHNDNFVREQDEEKQQLRERVEVST